MARARGFWRDRRGVSAIEFAFIAPVLILIYFGIAELSQAMLAERKVEHAASAVGDLVAQTTTTTQAGLQDVYTAASLILAPFSTTSLQIRVSSVSTDANDNATVTWSNGSNITKLATGAAVTLPSNLLGPSQNVIMSEVKYTFTSPLSYITSTAFHAINGPINFSQTFYLRPRLSSSVACTDC